ncbi:MAG: hypothetical protein ACREMM_10675 [Gemmatimonadales bacterium]
MAGTHGSEVAPIVALQRVRRELEPAQLRGTVLLVHVANLPSFLRRTVYYSPIDGKNLNRVYPGRGATARYRSASPTPSPARSSNAPTTSWISTPATATSRSGPTPTGARSASTRAPIRSRGTWRSRGGTTTS